VITFVVLLITAIVISSLTQRVRQQSEAAGRATSALRRSIS